MELDLTSFFDKGGSGLKRLDIRAMADFGLRIAANDLVLPARDDKLLFLLFSAHNLNTLDEHSQVNGSWQLHH